MCLLDEPDSPSQINRVLGIGEAVRWKGSADSHAPAVIGHRALGIGHW